MKKVFEKDLEHEKFSLFSIISGFLKIDPGLEECGRHYVGLITTLDLIMHHNNRIQWNFRLTPIYQKC